MWTKFTVVVLFALCGSAIGCIEITDEQTCNEGDNDCMWVDGGCKKGEDPCSKIADETACGADDSCSWDVNTCKYEATERATERTLSYFTHGMQTTNYGPPPTTGHGQQHIDGNTCKKFPYTCRPDKYNIKTLEPPVNIPYCQRIPCPVVDQRLREKTQSNFGACVSQPGCFYDKELYYYRRVFGNSVLPDVPVCHLVIRNQVFLEHARKYAAQYNDWNPLLTKCLMETYHDEIYGDTPGCYMASILDYFGYRPRVAGWRGISPQECHSIDGCWLVNGKGCAYPVEGSEAEFRPFPAKQAPEQPRTVSHNPFEIYNRVACHRFRNLYKADDFLDTYHQCMASGCILDPVVQNFYHSHFRNMTITLPPHIQTIFWRKVLTNEIRADNFREKIYHLQTLYANRRPSTTPVYNPFLPYQSHYYTNTAGTYPYHQGATPYTLPGDYNMGSMHTGGGYPYGYQQGYGGYQQGYGGYQQGYGGYGGYGYNIKCPYQQIRLKNFPTLHGSFKGCCERNLCYAPAGNVHTSVLTSYYTTWSAWSTCTASCGGGNQTRSRTCVGQLGRHCDAASETQPCNEHVCPVWGSWTEFSDCTASCGSGVQSRSRSCVTGQCMGAAVETVRCNAPEACQQTYAPPPSYPYGQAGAGYQSSYYGQAGAGYNPTFPQGGMGGMQYPGYPPRY